MKLIIKGTPKEIKKALQAISGSEEHQSVFNVGISIDHDGENFVTDGTGLKTSIEKAKDESDITISVHERGLI